MTFKQARELLHRFITPHGPDSEETKTAINFAVERLTTWMRSTNSYTQLALRVYTHPKGYKYVTTPPSLAAFHKVLYACKSTGQSAATATPIQDSWYQWSQDGFGTPPVDSQACAATYLQRIPGTFALPQEPGPGPLDIDIQPTVIGTIFQISYADGQKLYTVSNTPDSDISSISFSIPGEDTGICTVSRDGTIFGEFSMPTSPALQRYRVLGLPEDTHEIVALATRSFQLLTFDLDEIFPDNINALRYAVQGFIYDQQNDAERAQTYWQLARQALDDETKHKSLGAQNTVEIQIPSLMNFRPMI